MKVLVWLKEQSRKLNDLADRKLLRAEKRLREIEND